MLSAPKQRQPTNKQAKILAALWARKKYTVAEYLLARPNYVFGLPEVLRAIKLLDLPRRIRQFVKKVFGWRSFVFLRGK